MTGMEAVAGFTFNWLSSCQPFKSGIITSSRDRKSTRLNSSHLVISYAVFCLKKHSVLAILLPNPLVTIQTRAAQQLANNIGVAQSLAEAIWLEHTTVYDSEGDELQSAAARQV